MINLLGLGKHKPKGVKVTIEYCPRSVTLPYKIKKIINEASVTIPEENSGDPFGFTDKEVRVGEFLNELQVKYLVSQTRNYQNNYETVEIIESDYSSGDSLIN